MIPPAGVRAFRYACHLAIPPSVKTWYDLGWKAFCPTMFASERLWYIAKCSPTNPFELLAHFGRDCPGAVQVCRPHEVTTVLDGSGAYEPVSESEIRRRLLRAQSQSEWMDESERWTLGGAQGKIALARIGDAWHVCHGSAATTHIIKPGVEGLTLRSLDEYLCMRLARICGLKAATVSYEEFDGVPAIVVERYDRMIQTNGAVTRIHQEDLCQALGYLPKDKYVPTPADIPSLLKSDASDQSVYDFVSALFFNYLIGATDAHAKNYSLMHLVGQERCLAPIYDVASIPPIKRWERAHEALPCPSGARSALGGLQGPISNASPPTTISALSGAANSW